MNRCPTTVTNCFCSTYNWTALISYIQIKKLENLNMSADNGIKFINNFFQIVAEFIKDLLRFPGKGNE